MSKFVVDSGVVLELRRRAEAACWEAADELGWAETYQAECLALTELQADAQGLSVSAMRRRGSPSSMDSRRKAVADDLRALADDFKSLLESATTDPKERRRKQRRWAALYAAIGVVTTQVARRSAAKIWAIATGERPPTATSGPSRR
jgi:hypothetical protein